MLHQEQQDRYALRLRFFNNRDRVRCLRFLHKPFVMARDAIFMMNLPPGNLTGRSWLARDPETHPLQSP